MRIGFVTHSVVSCWNNGNAHFLRGVIKALVASGHAVRAFEAADGWSRTNLAMDAGPDALRELASEAIGTVLYHSTEDALAAIDEFGADLLVVHEWNDPALVNALGQRHVARTDEVLLFHDTHHRAISRPEEMQRFDLSGYDGVLAFGACIARIYERRGWGNRVWTWHEAADTRLFKPPVPREPDRDLVWIGNWGDGERSEEIRTFLLEPATELGLSTAVYGVRYPEEAISELRARKIGYGGWLPNNRVPEIFARHRATVHVPRRPYVKALPGIPTIRVFEALACGIPLVSAPWSDEERLFPQGSFLMARDGEEMTSHLRSVLGDEDLAVSLIETGLAAILSRHTCDHRAAELLDVHRSIASPPEVLRKAAS
jgi:spore maturation protein CgeB